ncbi:MAG: hypothetical protein ACTS27_10425 [Phycisphaerales bacterium]
MLTASLIVAAVLVMLLTGAAVLHLVARAAPRAHDGLCRAPLLDLVVAYFTAAPWFVGALLGMYAGELDDRLAGIPWYAGVGAGVLGQLVALIAWCRAHEFAHREAVRGPRIVKALNRSVGRVRNHTAVLWTAWAVPVFWLVRIAEVTVYPPLIVLVKFPRYRQREWVNVSRHKFSGLVGHDLIWCLYCDWMTGVWSLGSEMLRNVESFWCPIRFIDAKKCENCAVDFPDIDRGWVRPEAGMAGAVAKVEAMYPQGSTVNDWFARPERAERTRLTVNGREPESSSGDS